MTNAVNLGIGMTTGMFFHAPAGTALPATPSTALGNDWKEVGYVSEDGITWHHGRSAEPLKDWSKSIRRMLQEDSTGTVSTPIISTTKEVLETIFGADHVTTTTATQTAGEVISVEAKEGAVSGEEAFLFLMKDGDDILMLGTTRGYITTVDDITFAPGAPITWNATVSGDAWKFAKEAGASN